ncbi:MAG: type II toxin-antitoxin system death-on-curing family toxin [Ruminococcaceae bacterium]|nr:type II toxin-antitoxin system death-on-curing family toxin [Oscillospiraceae bacterium]MBR3595470.1 type II toxin-antitoxin system death-on-curing family toxin [Clostridia bacterium]
MMLLTVEEIKGLHGKLIARTGGSDGLRDENLLESAVYSALASFGNEECYPTTEEKAVRLMFALTNNHAFTDGNKRIGVLVMLMTLKLNGIEIKYTQKELIKLGLSVADSSCDYDGILDWIISHKIRQM